MDQNKQRPDYRAFTVIKKNGVKDFWLPIGAAYQHRDQAGINILLQAAPLDGKIVLRPMDDEDKSAVSARS